MKTPLKTRVEPYIDDIKHRRMTVKETAKLLKVGYTYLSKILNEIGGQPEPGQRAQHKRLTQTRREFREQLARTLPIDKAAKAAHCHPRTIQRLLDKLK